MSALYIFHRHLPGCLFVIKIWQIYLRYWKFSLQWYILYNSSLTFHQAYNFITKSKSSTSLCIIPCNESNKVSLNHFCKKNSDSVTLFIMQKMTSPKHLLIRSVQRILHNIQIVTVKEYRLMLLLLSILVLSPHSLFISFSVFFRSNA